MVRSKRIALAAILVFLFSLVSVVRLVVALVSQSEFVQDAGVGDQVGFDITGKQSDEAVGQVI